MTAIVKPIEAKAVHQIQSGQVIVDLCSVVKELVENSLDAGANAIEVRFKNNGLDEIEVQDNGSGIASVNYESVALKHYTSKLSTYDDLSSLQTFGFRGEALSSLCALSSFTITTARADEAPKGHRLEFETSGKLKNITVVACQKGTIATVQNLFERLPVRRKELSKNIKREYGKVLGLLHAYACVSTNVKFTVKNAMPKGKSLTVFATKSNPTTRENIANVYGARTTSALVALDLSYDFPQGTVHSADEGSNLTNVMVQGHISKPVFGEGRQTPDRQMFFVNGRPCGLPQIAKAINEVYKSFNVSQSPFIFADFQMDTGAYDVNVSPDKRTIFLHNATALVEGLKQSLTELFDQQDQTVPQSTLQTTKFPSFRPLGLRHESSTHSSARSPSMESSGSSQQIESTTAHGDNDRQNRAEHDLFRDFAVQHEDLSNSSYDKQTADVTELEEQGSNVSRSPVTQTDATEKNDKNDDTLTELEGLQSEEDADRDIASTHAHVRDFNARIAEEVNRKRPRGQEPAGNVNQAYKKSVPLSTIYGAGSAGTVQNAFDHMRPKRLQPEIATITIGDRTVTRLVGSQLPASQRDEMTSESLRLGKQSTPSNNAKFAGRLLKFTAPGTQMYDRTSLERIEAGEDEEGSNSPKTTQSDQEPNDEETSGGENSSSHEIAHESAEQTSSLVDASDERAAEERRVSELIKQAEDAAQHRISGGRRASQALKGGRTKDSIASLAMATSLDLEELAKTSAAMRQTVSTSRVPVEVKSDADNRDRADAEERLSLTVSKTDFLNMHIVGQFNLGFILAVRNKRSDIAVNGKQDHDELFIIDQHASDEKYNFEKLQAETTVGNQRMVRSVVLDLTAVEEEIIMANTVALERNGFIVDIDSSGEQEVGRRCELISLPLSKEVVFGTRDLDELIHLLAESPMLNDASPVPRPSKVRKMFAMRACRSSIMIGKTLSKKQMSSILQHMGSIDKPWNCPHGRPTMRHLASLDTFNESIWIEGDGVSPGYESTASGFKSASTAWRTYST